MSMLPHLNAEEWQEDLAYLTDGLRRMHRNLFHAVSQQAFDAAECALHKRIPWLMDHEVIVELARLVALVGDGHTVLRLVDVPGLRRYPLRIERFSDGLFVRTTSPEFREAAGACLVAINDVPTTEAYERVRPLASRDNEMGVLATAPELLTMPEVLHAVGLTASPDHAVFTVRLGNGALRELNVHPFAAPPPGMVDARATTRMQPPLWLRQPDANWFEHLPAEQAVYVGHNQVRDGEDQSLATFFDAVFALIEREGVDRLILDIRRNYGGNNLLNRTLLHHLIRCDRINRWGGLFVIIGRHTFSAAMYLAVDLEKHTRVIFVGEPTGARPNHYGENGKIILPLSRLRVSVATLWWQTSMPSDDRPWIPPDIPTRLSFADYAANHDPAVDAALRYQRSAAPELDYPDRLIIQLRRTMRSR